MNIFYIGSSGPLSLLPFEAILASAHKLTAVGVYKPVMFQDKIIALENKSLALAARHEELTVVDLSLPVESILSLLEKHQIDIILMSCYAKRLPQELLEWPAGGCFNMHPSLLPGYRGPEPVFWQMRNAAEMGVSWHRVISRLDAGDIVAQQIVSLDDDLGYSEVNDRLASCGASLLMELLSDIDSDSLRETPQDEGLASYYPYPQAGDFSIDLSNDARQLYNFMKATQVFHQPYRCQIGDYDFLLEEAIDFDNNRVLDEVLIQGDRLYIPSSEGVLTASFTDKMKV